MKREIKTIPALFLSIVFPPSLRFSFDRQIWQLNETEESGVDHVCETNIHIMVPRLIPYYNGSNSINPLIT